MEHNNQSMATITETFFIEETVNLIHDGDALKKWNDRCEELGLCGQKEIVKTDKSPIPFLWMNSAIVETFEVLCPTKVSIEKYNKTPIPVEILDLVALCKKEQYFELIEIWYNERVKDPVCVGYKVPEDKITADQWYQKYYAQKYLIGRWADVKASLDQLVERAKTIFIREIKNRIQQEIKDRQRCLEDLETVAENKFGNAMPTTSLPF